MILKSLYYKTKTSDVEYVINNMKNVTVKYVSDMSDSIQLVTDDNTVYQGIAAHALLKNIIKRNANKTEVEWHSFDTLVNAVDSIQHQSNRTKVVYTCITGTYDSIRDPITDSPEWDYICFTNNKDISSDVWDVIYVNDSTLSNVKIQRHIKILYNRYLKSYTETLWLDGNCRLTIPVNKFIGLINPNKVPFVVSTHPERSCTYDEMLAVVKYRRDKEVNVAPMRDRYKSEGLPVNAGMVDTNVLYRVHTPDLHNVMEQWWTELFNGSHRDQLSLNYVMWKTTYSDIYTFPHTLKWTYVNLANHKG